MSFPEQTEKRLHLLSRIAEQMGEGICLFDLDGNVMFVNDAFAEMHRYAPGELRTQNLSLFHSPKQMQGDVGDLNRQAMSQGSASAVVGRRRKDGQEFLSETTASVLTDEDEKPIGLIYFARDVSERAEAERKLRESERLYRKMFESNGAIMLLLDPETSKVVDANPAAVRFYGYSKQELSSMLLSSIDVLPFRSLSQRLKRAAQESGTSGESIHRLADGTYRHVEIDSCPIRVDERFVLHSIIHDVSQRKQVEETLRQSEKKYRSLFENMDSGFAYHKLLLDDQGVPEDFEFVEVNQSFSSLFKAEGLLVSGKSGLALYRSLGGDPQVFLDRFARVAFGEPEARFETYFEPLKRWLSFYVYSPRAGYFVTLIDDITSRKESEQALIESEARYRRLSDVAFEGIVLHRDGLIQEVNRAACSMFGYEQNELLGQSILTLVCEPEQAKMRSQLLELNEFSYESQGCRKDGSLFPVEIIGRPVLFDGQQTRVSILRDISSRKKSEREKAALEVQLQQAQKLESIGTLASGVAHEINNPINAIMNYAQLIDRRLKEKSSLNEFARAITHESNRVATIVRNLLSFARRDMEMQNQAHPADIVEATLSLIQSILRKDDITLVTDIPEGLPRIPCRSQQIQQVLMNLITNARDALNERFPGFHEEKKILLSITRVTKQGKPFVRMTIEDHGSGIPTDVRGRIFDPFFTTKPRDRGTGLGLSVSHGIVRDHHGELSVESEPNQFTRFHVDLPAPEETPAS